MQRSLMDHPITPPPELVFQWHREACKDPYNGGTFFESKTLKHIATQAAQWGADQELEACCDWVSQWRCMVGGNRPEVGLRAARRPKPPSLKEQALALVRLHQRRRPLGWSRS
jgi:hypothetical protein